jgi:hypothetical protein
MVIWRGSWRWIDIVMLPLFRLQAQSFILLMKDAYGIVQLF